MPPTYILTTSKDSPVYNTQVMRDYNGADAAHHK